ncbi:MAG: transcription-repair coupling factor [Bacteroidales bacterium]|jgi:transcription-repair coupling factor (superfamily II helicase)|nr:transcription-repair coupling factor [Bacteroidales bacterium]
MESQEINKKAFETAYTEHPEFLRIAEISQQKSGRLFLSSLTGSAFSMLFYAIFQNKKKQHLIILPDKEKAAYIYNDLQKLSKQDEIFQFYPSAYKRSVEYNQVDNTNILLKTEVLNRISISRKPYVLVTYPEALIEAVVPRKALQENSLEMQVGDELSPGFIQEVLDNYEFEQTDFVYDPGTYAVRGGIIDIYSFSNEQPYRVEFFGDEVESIRSFDPETQISTQKFKKISIIPNIHDRLNTEKKVPFMKFLSDSASVWIQDPDYVLQRIESIWEKANRRFDSGQNPDVNENPMLDPHQHLTTPEVLKEYFRKFPEIGFGQKQDSVYDKIIPFSTVPQPAFQKNFDLLIQEIATRQQDGYQTYILSDNEKQIQRIRDIFTDKGETIQFESIFFSLHQGFIDNNLKTCVFTDHQIFERYHKYQLKGNFARKDAISLKEIHDLQPGDYVVHVDNGVGKFEGLQKIVNDGKTQEVIRIRYDEGDVLFVNVHSLHRISKYRDKEGEMPNIHRLGSGHWARIKDRTKKKVKDIARDLIMLYAKRQDSKGFAFSEDTYLQRELESSFIYEDTPDQLKSTLAIKEDMESKTPMDRLVCGDVGFGKTEVAVRAAFKSVADSKQVAVLVPTTILAFQHYNTFKSRLEDLPVRVDYVSRLKTSAEIKKTLQALKAGEIDILIGTHRLVSKDVVFKDLGLLIIDEEQKFGVTIKEKLKKLKLNVDTLTLTATPIPRTMQFSLMGARDLSVINTPPPNRHPIVTELHTFNHEIIREAIMTEVNRNGQVFFIHNRVQNIVEVETLIKRICPEVKVRFAHGQMEGKQLERIMLEYMRGDFDVLIATTIIENGLDIPNANTIIINNANNFGLSDLHQLRGRVGRSNKKAFCYLLAPPLTHVSGDARRRLKAIEEFTDLGSGINIAMQDLDIRGAGDILGGEQSGFISDMGYETYQKILKEAIQELKEDEFKTMFNQNQDAKVFDTNHHYVNDCQIETDFEVLLPDDYIESVSERIHLYRKLDNIEQESELLKFEAELKDRFGDLPEPVNGMLEVVRLRWIALKLGLQRIVIKNGRFIGYFPQDQKSIFYQSPVFSGIIGYMQKFPGKLMLKEQNNKLSLRIRDVGTIHYARNFLETMHGEIAERISNK